MAKYSKVKIIILTLIGDVNRCRSGAEKAPAFWKLIISDFDNFLWLIKPLIVLRIK
jgi:hypothetical protein